jgi:DNA repair protein SbcC/Rad50
VALDQLDVEQLDRQANEARAAATSARQEADAAAAAATSLATVLPAVTAVVERRIELIEAQADAAATESVAELDALLERFQAHFVQLEAAAGAAVAERDAALEQRALREAELEEARRQLRERHEARDEAICSRCGKPLDEEHRAAELARAEGEVERAEAAAATARDRQAALVEAATTAVAARDEAIELRRQAQARRTQAQAAAQRLARVETATSKALSAAAFERWDDERRAQFVDAEGDRLPALLADLEAAAEAAATRAAETTQELSQAEQTARRAEEARAGAERRRVELRQVVDKAQAHVAAETRHAEVLLADVPEPWGDRARTHEEGLLDDFDQRRAALANAAAELAQLERAENELLGLRASVEQLEAQLSELPPTPIADGQLPLGDAAPVADPGRMVVAAEEALVAARAELAATDRELDDARLEVTTLRERDEARAATVAEQGRASSEARLAGRMVQLLSRQGLQGQLLVDATRALETLANEVLVTLTGGTLQLEIRFAEQRGRDELTVYARDFNAGGERTDAAFLSGSEKFRVCVAMAAAVGAYGSSRYKVESLIIDEGFGSLDEQRRGEMIDELRRLAGLLERVIVVSHQADFQNRAQFPHGYRLRRVDGETTVERYV